MGGQELFYLIMGIWLLSMIAITICAFAADAKINKRIRQREKEYFKSLIKEIEEEKGVR